MNKQEYIKELKTVIIQDMVKDVNSMLGASKTAFLATSLLLKLQPIFSVVECKHATLPKASTIEDLDAVFRSYVPFSDPTVVVFELHYNNKKTLKRALKLASKFSTYFSFHYIKHLHATLAQVNSHAHIQAMMRSVKDKESPFLIVSAAIDREMTTLALKTLHSAGQPTGIMEKVTEGLTTKSATTEMIKIAADMAEKVITKIPKYILNLRIKPIEHLEEVREVCASHVQGQGWSGYSKGETSASVLVDLAQAISHTVASSCKGTAVGDLMATSFEANKINALWFEDLTRVTVSSVLQKSHEGYSSWGNLSKTKRHMYHSPVRISEDHKLVLYVTIDHSGSVSTGDLQKILSVFEEYSHLISSAVVMHHTSAVIQQYVLDDSFGDIAEHPEFKAAFATRSGNGGTSHLDCVKRIADHLEQSGTDPEKAIWLSFSDGYSDLEDVCVSYYDTIDKLETYFIRDSSGRDINLECIPGINYNIETP